MCATIWITVRIRNMPKSKKKILFRLGSFPTKSETFITNQIVLAIKLDYDVSILTTKKNTLSESSQPEIIENHKILDKTIQYNKIVTKNYFGRIQKIVSILIYGIPLSYLKTFNYFKYGKQGLIGNLLFQLVEMRGFLDVDLYHIQFGTNKYPLDSLKKHNLIKGSVIATFHGYDGHYQENSKRKIAERYSTLFRFADLITCNTTYLASRLHNLGCSESKLRIIPMGINIDFFYPYKKGQKSISHRILSVGRLVKLKGFEYGIKAVNELVKRGLNVSYQIIGQGKEKENLLQLTKSFNISDYVFIEGAKSAVEIRDAIQQADIFLMTSTYDKTGRREAQGIVTIEAQACGLPVVAFRSGGVPYTIGDGVTGFLSKENDYMDMAKNIQLLIQDERLRTQMGENARTFVEEHFNQNKLNKIWEELYVQLSS